jgi:AcrR family transcriptional regulator
MREDDLRTIAGLLRERNIIDARIAAVIGRPMTAGHLGEWIAASVFDIELENSAASAAFDGRFVSDTLQGYAVNVKWYLKPEGRIDVTESDALDYYLVLAGPAAPATHSRGTSDRGAWNRCICSTLESCSASYESVASRSVLPPVCGLLGDRPEPPASPVPLDRERIVAAAIALADEGGLEAVSVRKVAARLKAGPMRLCGFIATKQELFDLLVDEVYAEILPEWQPGDWREALRVLACRTRQAALRHEWLADLLGGRPAMGPNSLAVAETTLAALDGLADVDTVMRVVETVSAYFTGAIRREIANLRAEHATGPVPAGLAACLRPVPDGNADHGPLPGAEQVRVRRHGRGRRGILHYRPGVGPGRRGRQTHPAAGLTPSPSRRPCPGMRRPS